MRPLSTDASADAAGPVTAASGRFDPFDPGYVLDPYPTLAELQASEPVFFAPATSRNRAMVRLTLNAALTDAEMEHVLRVAEAIAPKVKPWDWPIAKRRAQVLASVQERAE